MRSVPICRAFSMSGNVEITIIMSVIPPPNTENPQLATFQ
jgi:hypothetical protein